MDGYWFEAYEEFEDFLERIYAYIGMTSRNAWYLEDFGRAKLSELDDKSFDWYLDRVRHKYRLRHRDLLTRIRDVYPELKSVEENNIYNVHVRVAVELIENLRHRIVHTRGIVRDRDDFVKNILEKSGLWNNGRPKPGLKQFVEWFLQHNAGTYTVSLSERRTAPLGSPIDSYIDVWDELMTYLMAYAYSICSCVCPVLSGREPPHHSPATPHPGSHQPVVADGSQAVSPRSPQSRTSDTPSRSRFSVDFSAQMLDGATVPSREADPAAQKSSSLRTTGTQQGGGDTAGHTRDPAVDEQQRQTDRRGSGDFEHEDRLGEEHVPENQGSDGTQKRNQRNTASSRAYENLEEDNVPDGGSQQDQCPQGQSNLGDGHRNRPPSIDDGDHDGDEESR